jgi:FtsP/CotA-like multicopper oxidase with cupredoxin domain
MPPAGTYLLTSVWWGGPMPPLEIGGTSGVMVSRPSSGLQELWNGGPRWDREYVLLYEDTDSRYPLVTDQAGGIQYEPDYFTLNGYAFPDTVSQSDIVIAGNNHDRILIRLCNLGRMRQCIHYHGFHVDVEARNNVPETIFGPKDTIPVPHGETTDVILTANQRGVFPVHPHSLTAVTAGGLYPLGQLTLITIN